MKKNDYDFFINQSLLIVYKTKSEKNPNGFIKMSEVFKKLPPLPAFIDGGTLSYYLGRKYCLLKPYSEVGRGNWVLTDAGMEMAEKLLEKEDIDSSSNFDIDVFNSHIDERVEMKVVEKIRELEIATPEANKTKKILILGDSQINANQILKLAKKYKISPKEVVLELDYQKNKRFNVGELQYSDKFSHMLIGPNSHKMVNLGSYESLISRLREDEGFPNYIELREINGDLKITKKSLAEAFKKITQ